MFKMVKKIYLSGGAKIIERETEEVDRKIFNEAENKAILIIDYAKKELSKDYKELFINYLKTLGATKINFISDNENIDNIKNIFNLCGIIIILGGDIELLLERINEKNIKDLIKNYKGIIFGISAGAYLLCEEYIKIRNNKVEKIKCLGVLNIKMKAHYGEKFDKQLLKLSKDNDVYGVPEKSVIIVEGNIKSFIGNIYLFSKGEKIKIN